MDFKEIEILSCNSFFGGKLVAHFLSGCENQKIRTEFIFLLLPFIFKKDSREILFSSKSTSTLFSTFLDSKNTKGRTSIAGLEKRLTYFQNTTQTSIIIAVQNYNVLIDEFISLKTPIDYRNEKDGHLQEFFKASHYLGKILSKTELFDTFLKLGLKEL